MDKIGGLNKAFANRYPRRTGSDVGLLAQSGGLQGLANKFSQSRRVNAFASWLGMAENQPISSDQIQNALGPDEVNALAAKMGVDPAQASHFLAEYLPKIADLSTANL